MIERNRLQDILELARSKGGDFSEAFFEEQDETNITQTNGMVQGVKTKHIKGVGLYVLAGVQSIYLYSNDTSEASLTDLALRASGLMEITLKQNQKAGTGKTLQEVSHKNPNTILRYPSTVSYKDKIRLLQETYETTKDNNQLLSSQLDYFDTDRRILIANSEGLYTGDRRISSRVRFKMVTGDEKNSFSHWEDYTRAKGFEAFIDNKEYFEFAKNLPVRMENMRTADTIRPGVMPVVLAKGACGTLWHECCGHTLEATAIASKQSFFVDKIGEKVASDKVTLLDDGTLGNYYGSDAIDDEGHKKQRNVLIEDGVLKEYMCDRLHGRMIGRESTGNGRRQNYTFAPVARMTNTYLAPGKDEEEEMIRSLPEGLYVESLGGGFGGTQFSIQVNEGYLIKNGQIDRQIKGIMLTGNGLDIMKKVDRVGKDLGFEGGSFCGAASGLVPVTAMQPMVRISEMSVG